MTETIRQSRIGKKPLLIPAGVDIQIQGQKITVKGPKGTSERMLHTSVALKKEGTLLNVDAKEQGGNQFQGLSWSLISNMIEGVSKGFEVQLDLIGTGYRAELKGQDLLLNLGLSHQITFPLPASVKAKVDIIEVEKIKRPRLTLTSHDKEKITQAATHIRSFRPPEPYKGKGVRFVGEKVRQKEGKAASKGKK